MILHLAEVWATLLVAFVLGCFGGAMLFAYIARGRFASVQWAIADAMGRVSDRLRDRFGMTPVWRRQRAAAAPPTSVAEPAAEPVWQVVDRAVAARTEALRSASRTPEPMLEDDAMPLPVDLDATRLADTFETHADLDDDRQSEPAREPARPAPPPLVRALAGPPPRRPSTQLPPAAPPPQLRRPERPSVPPRPRDVATPRMREMPVPPFAANDDDLPAETADVRKPATLPEPRNGVPDNLQRIKGIGDRNEVRLNKLGIYHFSQIAAWTPAEIRWIGQLLAFPERIEHDDWVGQAIILGSGGQTGFTKSSERRRARRRSGREAAERDEESSDES